ncbi:hypothetical protein [Streptomyces sp. NPDC006668]|uniref:hypothetical protein n=1 Tax=Streptomyces sp. NPDC006668 TaxID=3156903 RepID=UPI0033C4E2CA
MAHRSDQVIRSVQGIRQLVVNGTGISPPARWFLADFTRTRLKKMRYRPDFLDGFIAETGLTRTPP